MLFSPQGDRPLQPEERESHNRERERKSLQLHIFSYCELSNKMPCRAGVTWRTNLINRDQRDWGHGYDHNRRQRFMLAFPVKVNSVSGRHVKGRGYPPVAADKSDARLTDRGDVCERILPLFGTDKVVFAFLGFVSFQDCKENNPNKKSR